MFDLNCLLGYFQPLKLAIKENVLYPDLKPHLVENGYNIFLRPNIDILFSELFMKRRNQYEIGIWSSQDKENTDLQIRHFLKNLRYK